MRVLRRSIRRFSSAAKAASATQKNPAEAWASTVDAAGIAAAAPRDLTHEVSNQATALTNYNSYKDPALREAVHGSGGAWAEDHLLGFGAQCGSAHWQAEAAAANLHKPVLRTHDRFGHRVDVVDYHPAYHELMRLSLESGVSSFGWRNHHRAGAQTARGALMHMMYQLESGVCCPTTMTFAAPPALASTPSVAAAWEPLLHAAHYDPRDVPLSQKAGATLGMSMTEKQGGSDVRANTTVATPVHAGQNGPGDQFTLIGHKWFTSAPMSDGFLTLAQTAEGVSCFLVPRWLPDGTRNSGFRVMRLKNKIGDLSNASSEVEFSNAWGVMVGSPGRGVKTIVEMVVHTRLDCTIGSAALMRSAAQLAFHHASHRNAFGTTLSDAPLMRGVLSDLAVESEAATATWARLCRAFDGAASSEHEAALRRVATAIGKYWVCKRAPSVAYEAMECHGGNGYVEDGPIARLYRQSPLNSIWEGSGNVIALDILRALRTEPNAAPALLAEVGSCRGADARLDALADDLAAELSGAEAAAASGQLEPRARLLCDKMALALQAATLVKHGHPAAAAAYCASRLPGRQAAGWNFGATMMPPTDFSERSAQSALLERLELSA